MHVNPNHWHLVPGAVCTLNLQADTVILSLQQQLKAKNKSFQQVLLKYFYAHSWVHLNNSQVSVTRLILIMTIHWNSHGLYCFNANWFWYQLSYLSSNWVWQVGKWYNALFSFATSEDFQFQIADISAKISSLENQMGQL